MSRSRLQQDLLDTIAKLEKRVKKLEAGNRGTNTSLESGNFVLNGGSIDVTDTSGNVIFRLARTGNDPTVTFTPTEGNVNNKRIKFTGHSYTDKGTQLEVQVQNFDGTPSGGYLTVGEYGVALTHDTAGKLSGIIASNDLARPSALLLKGIFYSGLANNIEDQAVIVGSVDVPAGFSSITVTYGKAFDTNVIPLVSVLSTTGGPVSWSLSNQTPSAFTVEWSGTTAKTISYWAFANV